MSDENVKKLREMAQLGILANRISEIQEKNLKMYPFVFFEGVTGVKVDYNLSKVNDDGGLVDGKHYVAYYLTLNEKENDHLDKRFQAIVQSTRLLFWNDLEIMIYFNDKLVHGTNNE